MRILQVIHQFPPHSSQGSEVHCQQLSILLSSTCEVGVFHISNIRPSRPRRLIREKVEGLSIFHCVDGAEYARTADWPNEFLCRQFRQVLAEFRPEVVHFHNYLSLGDDLVGMVKSFGAKVVYTLHDFGLICPNSILLKSDGTLCGKSDGEYFQDCCPVPIRVSGGQVPMMASKLPSLSRWRMFADQFHLSFLRPFIKTGVSLAETWFGHPAKTDVARKREFFLRQTRVIFEKTDLFLAPSEFLRQRYISCGLPEGKVRFLRYGMRLFDRVQSQNTEGALRFGYIGALHAHKGVEVLLNAFEGLGDRAVLHIYGSAFGSPVSENHWRRISSRERAGVVFHGRYDNARIGEILAGLDAVVVPSVWFENSPLTIQEAFIAGVPVVTSDQGGMAELVRDGVDGLHFRLGDSDDLREKLASLIEHPGKLRFFASNIPDVPGIEQQAAEVGKCYEELLADA